MRAVIFRLFGYALKMHGMNYILFLVSVEEFTLGSKIKHLAKQRIRITLNFQSLKLHLSKKKRPAKCSIKYDFTEYLKHSVKKLYKLHCYRIGHIIPKR